MHGETPVTHKISIHASLTGGDCDIMFTERMVFHDFNPRLPHGRRRVQHVGADQSRGISIHASLAGGDVEASGMADRWPISIHASLAGGDINSYGNDTGIVRFQSTPPSREATRKLGNIGAHMEFQSTPPSREATS